MALILLCRIVYTHPASRWVRAKVRWLEDRAMCDTVPFEVTPTGWHDPESVPKGWRERSERGVLTSVTDWPTKP